MSSGRTGKTLGPSTRFFLNRSKSAIDLFLEWHRLAFLTGVEHLVEKFYCFFGAELYRAHAGAHQPLLHDRDTLLELCDLFFERPVRLFAPFLLFPEWQECERTPLRDVDRRRVRHCDEEIFCHDIGGFGEALYELDIFADLDAHEVVELLLVRGLQCP